MAYKPDYNVGDWVIRRPGTLGNMDGRASSGRVEAIEVDQGHTMATVVFGGRRETFTADTYTRPRAAGQ
jgi:hypothetical protein